MVLVVTVTLLSRIYLASNPTKKENTACCVIELKPVPMKHHVKVSIAIKQSTQTLLALQLFTHACIRGMCLVDFWFLYPDLSFT